VPQSSPPDSLHDFLLDRMHSMLDRPQMYASSPDALEDMLALLSELLLRFSCQDVAKPKPEYRDILMARNFGSANYCGRMRYDCPGVSDEELWSGLVATWKAYLAESVE
jgi:hypothetical protein